MKKLILIPILFIICSCGLQDCKPRLQIGTQRSVIYQDGLQETSPEDIFREMRGGER